MTAGELLAAGQKAKEAEDPSIEQLNEKARLGGNRALCGIVFLHDCCPALYASISRIGNCLKSSTPVGKVVETAFPKYPWENATTPDLWGWTRPGYLLVGDRSVLAVPIAPEGL